jgi:hypothetical protein
MLDNVVSYVKILNCFIVHYTEGEIMDKLSELEQRLEEYRKHSFKAEQTALQKLAIYPPFSRPLTAVDILRRELLRHHTRTLLLDEMKQWIAELRGMRLYQLYTIVDDDSHTMFAYSVRQYMTEQEVTEVNATFEKNQEKLRWRPVDVLEEMNNS